MYVVSGFLLALALYIPPGSRSASTATRTGYRHGPSYRRGDGQGSGVATPLTGECKATQETCVIQVYRASEAFMIPYIDLTPQNAGARHGVWMR